MKLRLVLLSLMFLTLSAPAASDDLVVYFVDVEGGQATLFVTPSGQSILIDAGWPGQNDRDADRIVAAAKEAGVKQIDYFIATHYHTDHIGGVPALAAKIPIKNFVDHGETVEHSANSQALYDAYMKEVAKGNHIVVKPGDKLPIKGLTWTIVTAGGKVIEKPLSGGGKPNPFCADFKPRQVAETEDGQSVGSMIQFGRFRAVDLGDFTWNKEFELMCPNNRLGQVDLYIASVHGSDASNSPALVHALHPKVAILDNGARKGASPAAWDIIRRSPASATSGNCISRRPAARSITRRKV